MPYLSRLATILALAALASVALLLFAGSQQASASPAQALKTKPAVSSPVESVGYSKRYRRAYAVDIYAGEYSPQPNSRRGVNYEIKELQRLFPETNWPPSMRVKHF